jgi:hypothetical protein
MTDRLVELARFWPSGYEIQPILAFKEETTCARERTFSIAGSDAGSGEQQRLNHIKEEKTFGFFAVYTDVHRICLLI